MKFVAEFAFALTVLAGCATGTDGSESNEVPAPVDAKTEDLSKPVIGVIESPISPRQGRFAAVDATVSALDASSRQPVDSSLSGGDDGVTEVVKSRYSPQRVRELEALRAAMRGAR